MLGLVIPGQSSRPSAFGVETGEVSGCLKEGESLFERDSPATLNHLHAPSLLDAFKFLGLSCFQNDLLLLWGRKIN